MRNAIQELRDKICKIVTLTRTSYKAKNFFFECKKKVGFVENLVLVSETEQRWNSYDDMLERALELKNALALFFQNEDYEDYSISNQEWVLMRQLRTVLLPMKKVSKYLSGSKYSTLSSCLPFATQLI